MEVTRGRRTAELVLAIVSTLAPVLFLLAHAFWIIGDIKKGASVKNASRTWIYRTSRALEIFPFKFQLGISHENLIFLNIYRNFSLFKLIMDLIIWSYHFKYCTSLSAKWRVLIFGIIEDWIKFLKDFLNKIILLLFLRVIRIFSTSFRKSF